MIVFFPTPYPDELLYSTIGRLKKWSGEANHRNMLQHIFGDKHITASVDLPSKIGGLVERLPITTQITVEQLIMKHTLFPFYSAFLPPGQADAVYRSMAEGSGNDIYSRIGIMGSSVRPNKYIRYCTECLSHDIKTYGEGYWHRMHQVPGLDVCVEHGIELLNSTINLHGENKYKFIAADESNSPLDCIAKRTSSDEMEKYHHLSNNIKLLLDNNYPKKTFDWFEQYYWNKLKELGYCSAIGHKVDQDSLCRDFISYFGESFLKRLQSGIYTKNNWLKQLTRKHQRTFHPIRHLLFLQFINSDIDEIFFHSESYKPFGDGPWICMNPAANHYGRLVVNKIDLTLKDKKSIGTFHCSCGFVYTLRAGEDAEKSIKVKRFGMIWEKECKRLAEAGMILDEIGRRLNANKRTVKKYIDKEEGREEEERQLEEEKQRTEDRLEWKAMQKKYPYLSRTELRKLNPTLFNRLYRSDRFWLEKESPSKVRKRVASKPRVNWESRDRELVEKIKKAVVDIQSKEGKPKQISIRSIGLAIGNRTLLDKFLDKLPLTKACLKLVVENNEQYRWRRLKWAIEELKQERRKFSKWEVLRKAGTRPETVDSSIIETMINSEDPVI
ncbi:TnsD family transposase [Paenibacillus polymyxa]|uniref:TnsD family transposase n=1 Tax=Paenibacillus polymyxa TaxID=1406 RepID=UPI002019B526|nr:TnsD family transposase [Paenibacillus polymyxa]UQQ36192.1 TnsD family transposase [Paenibacillus polymyxa]